MINSEFEHARGRLSRLHANLSQVVFGQERKLQWLLAAFSAGGHVLLEDVPDTGKTTLAKALALSCEANLPLTCFL